MPGDILGWVAAILTIAAFSMRRMLLLRCFAIAANIAFVLYGLSYSLYPVIGLHLVLLPCNAWRFMEARDKEARTRGDPVRAQSPR